MYPLAGSQPYPRNQWYVAAWSVEVGDAIVGRTILDTPIVLFRNADGHVAALDDRCPHRRFPLSKGWLKDGNIVCAYHGFTFSGSGACVHVPSQARPFESQLTTAYPVRERSNLVFVWLGDPEAADEALLPDLSPLHADDPEWELVVGGKAHLHARYMLLHDNILDLTHLSYLHRNSVGSPGISRARVKSTDLPNGLYVDREVLSDSMDGSPLGAALGIEGPVDRIMPQVFLAPCMHVTGPEFRSAITDGINPGHSYGTFRVIHAIVPETPTTTHYFWGITRNFRLGDASMTEALCQNVKAALAEDIEASEAIERMLALPGGPDEINCAADAAGAKGRRIIQSMIDEEGC